MSTTLSAPPGSGSSSTTVSAGGSASPATASAPESAVMMLVTDLRKDVATLKQQVGGLAETGSVGQTALSALETAINGKIDAVVARIQPIEAAIGAPDVAGAVASRIEALETTVGNIVQTHLPTLAALFGLARRNSPQEAIPVPGVAPDPVVNAPVVQSNVRRIA
jgi:hypothetical protein